jgi:CelD/BcsL family acetyltransferase involved in cellulose biosynthesis
MKPRGAPRPDERKRGGRRTTAAAGVLQLRLEALPAVERLERDWRALEAVAEPSFFTSWHWIGTLLAAVPAAVRPRLLRGAIGGRTVALGLVGTSLVRRRHGLVRSRSLYINETGVPLFDAMTIEHNGLLAATAHASDAADALVAWFAGQRTEADELHLSGSPERFSDDALEGTGLIRHEIARPCYSVDLDRLARSEGDICAVLSANARQQLRRAQRHYARYGPLLLTPAASVAEALAFFGAMKVLHVASWDRRGVPHAFSTPFFEPFHRLLIGRSFAAGATQLMRASAGETVLGYLYNFRLGERVYAYQSGFAYADARARPGVVTHALAIGDSFRAGAGVYDFLTGHNRLKESFATRCEPMLWQILQQPRLAFRLEHLGRRLKHWALRGDSGGPDVG